MRNNLLPRVSLAGQPVNVMAANDREIVIAPNADQLSGMLSIETEPGQITEMSIDLPAPKRVTKTESKQADANDDTGGES